MAPIFFAVVASLMSCVASANVGETADSVKLRNFRDFGDFYQAIGDRGNIRRDDLMPFERKPIHVPIVIHVALYVAMIPTILFTYMLVAQLLSNIRDYLLSSRSRVILKPALLLERSGSSPTKDISTFLKAEVRDDRTLLKNYFVPSYS
ncbi:uncharacterized protein LOC100898655 [Galendromus occidentalis]|uniref:Uncharacterized protein LOC100898655 n=1 Tax=Galendromus occidentalis TaxID=34638 RepID=A0AAJ6QX13_9ACAR|nr:uncharacterized protein LOC100898655 [Galendromus occidentalis]